MGTDQNVGRHRAGRGARNATGLCQEPGCHVLAIHCPRHGSIGPRPPSTRVVLENVIRELEFENPERWGPVIADLRGML